MALRPVSQNAEVLSNPPRLNIVVLNFSDFIKEWSFEPGKDTGHAQGQMVQIHEPGHPNHGKQGRIVRHQGLESGVDVGTGLSWHNRANLKRV